MSDPDPDLQFVRARVRKASRLTRHHVDLRQRTRGEFADGTNADPHEARR